MRRKQKNKRLIVALALILLVTISIGYAALSTTLTINGTANIAATSWNVHFESVNVTSGSVTGANVTTAPAVPTGSTTTTQLSYNVTLNQPGDFYEFTVDVVNGGTINAKIAENGITKTIKIGDNDLTEEQANLVEYTVTYADDTAIAEGDKLAKSGTTVNQVRTDKKTLKVRVAYKTDITPAQLNAVASDMALTLSFGLNYVQD